SSRRRHTRFSRDWSSDVCSSDLAIIKYRGWAASSEYIRRNTDDPITTNGLGDTQYVVTGYGINTQLSKMLSRKTELAVRYAFVRSEERRVGKEARARWVADTSKT